MPSTDDWQTTTNDSPKTDMTEHTEPCFVEIRQIAANARS